MDDWAAQLQANRTEKDEFFADDPRSPLDPTTRESFDGLAYFQPDPAYRVTATVTRHDDPEPVELDAENSPGERFLRAVTFQFQLPRDAPDERATDGDAAGGRATNETPSDGSADGQQTTADASSAELTLCGYTREPEDETLLVPFRDKTTGQETYRQGRYMDLHPSEPLADGDTVELDFNLAYTPFCAFDDAFVCPLPPEENWLSVAVRAGEREPPV